MSVFDGGVDNSHSGDIRQGKNGGGGVVKLKRCFSRFDTPIWNDWVSPVWIKRGSSFCLKIPTMLV
jgi:hypothetical protein